MAERSAALGDDTFYAGEGVVPAIQLSPPRIKDKVSYDALPAGVDYTDPEGKTRTKPYLVKSPADYDALPEGALYSDPQGQLRRTPKYEGIDFTAQTLYDMAATDKERRKALERSYPGKVKQDERTGRLYVDENGTLRRPKGFAQAPGAYLSAIAAPAGLSMLGEMGGAALGSVLPVAGTTGGAVAGGALGAAAGQAFNDAMLSLAGVYDRTGGEETLEEGKSALAGGLGTAAGRALGAAWPAVKGFAQNVAPTAMGKFLGADKEALEQTVRLRTTGTKPLVSPSRWAKEAPHLHLLVEKYDPTFHTQNPLLQSSTQHYEHEAGNILDMLGAERPKSLSDPIAAASTEKAGAALLGRSREELQKADSLLQRELEVQRLLVQVGGKQRAGGIEALRSAEAQARAAADKVINDGYAEIQKGIDGAMATVKAGRNSGELWQQVGDKLRKIKAAISSRAKLRYDQADQLAGGNLLDISALPEIATEVLAQMPEGFEGKYPAIVKQIRDLAGVRKVDKEGNVLDEWAKEPVHPTFGQLHNLRTVLRNQVNWYDLTPDFKEGALKFFSNHVDAVLHDKEAVPELQAAAHMLDETDKWYAKVIKPLTDKNIQAVVSGLESGMPADPKNLYNTLIKEGRTELTNKVRKLVGPNLWAAVKAADAQEMLNSAKTLTPGVIDGRTFARQVLERHKSGMLEAVHGKQAAQLLEQARRIEMLDGRLDIPARPGDTVSEIIARAHGTAEAVKEAARKDPLSTLNREMKLIERDHARQAQRLRQQRLTDPLAFLYKPTTGATEAVDKILGDEDLILAAAGKFGQNSPEFNMLRQVWAKRIFQGTLQPSSRLAKHSDEVQRIMFPGASFSAARQLAKDMDFLMGRSELSHGMAGLSAIAKVTNPIAGAGLGFLLGGAHGAVAGGAIGFAANPLARSMLGAFYKLLREGVNNVAFLRWIEKGLKGDQAARDVVRETVQRRMRIGGVFGAGAATGQTAAPNVP